LVENILELLQYQNNRGQTHKQQAGVWKGGLKLISELTNKQPSLSSSIDDIVRIIS